MSLAKRDAAYHTYAEYLTWPAGMRYELIDGAAYLISPAPLRVHQEIVGEICFQVRAALEGGRAYVAPACAKYGWFIPPTARSAFIACMIACSGGRRSMR